MKKSLVLTLLMIAVAGLMWGQTTAFFTETFGTVSGNTTIAAHETANGFDNDDVTYSGTADLRITTTSSGYTDASGGANVYFTNTNGTSLLIEGIDTSSYSSVSMSLGHHKSTNAGNNELVIEVSSNGTDWSPLTYNRPTGTGTAIWRLIEPTGTIPSTSNLRIRFHQTSTGLQFRIDDLVLKGTMITGPSISVSPATLSDFTYIHNAGPSAAQDFTVSGANLTHDISISAPTNYEISLAEDGDYTSSPIVLTQNSGSVSSTTIYVRLQAGLSIATYNSQNISITSTNATERTVTCSGSVTAPAPTVTVITRPTHIDLTSATSESAVLMRLENYPIDDIKYRLYNGSNQYSCYNSSNDTYVTSSTYSDGPSVPGTPTTSSTWWILFQRGNNNSVTASYRDRQGTTYGENYQTLSLPAATAIVSSYSINKTRVNFSSWTDFTNKHVVLAYDSFIGGSLISAASTAKTSGEFSVVVPTDKIIKRIEIRDVTNNLLESVLGSWSNGFDYPLSTPTPVNSNTTITVTGGNANNGTGTVPSTFNNPSFEPSQSFILSLLGTGPWTISIATDAPWGAYYRGGEWHSAGNSGGTITFSIESATKDLNLPIVLGDEDPATLPVSLSSFTAVMSAQNYVNLIWITESETNVNGYYIFRSSDEMLDNALMVSPLIRAANSSTQQSYIYTDRELYNSGTYYYWLQNVDFDGSSAFHGPVLIDVNLDGNSGAPSIPLNTAFSGIYPNPFNPNTYVSFALAKASNVSISIYNSRGQLIRKLMDESRNPGHHRIQWNGLDEMGNGCGTGVYYFRMQADGKSFTRKGLLIK